MLRGAKATYFVKTWAGLRIRPKSFWATLYTPDIASVTYLASLARTCDDAETAELRLTAGQVSGSDRKACPAPFFLRDFMTVEVEEVGNRNSILAADHLESDRNPVSA